jgi:DNA-binding NarL/FixJ family response regulator
MLNGSATAPAIADQTFSLPMDMNAAAVSVLESAPVPSTPVAGADAGLLTIGLIDFYRLTQECLVPVFNSMGGGVATTSFTSVQHCIREASQDLDLILYHLHGNDAGDTSIMQAVASICQAFPASPVIVFSDADGADQAKIMRLIVKSGARGFVPTQTATLPVTMAALRLVKAGGTFVPAELLVSPPADRAPASKSRLTSRQGAVLNHLQQGKANKIIAYELGMSESTVKVHVRNIMQKMGATNRTQAAYKAQRMSHLHEGGRLGLD